MKLRALLFSYLFPLGLLFSSQVYAEKPVDQQLRELLNDRSFNNQKVCQKISTLLTSGAGPNTVNKDGASALHFAAARGYEDLVLLLLKHKANPNLQTSRKGSALMNAAFYGHSKIVLALLLSGANTELRNGDYETAIHVASRKKHEEIVKILALFEADLNTTTRKRRTPLDLASGSTAKALTIYGANAKVLQNLVVPTLALQSLNLETRASYFSFLNNIVGPSCGLDLAVRNPYHCQIQNGESASVIEVLQRKAGYFFYRILGPLSDPSRMEQGEWLSKDVLGYLAMLIIKLYQDQVLLFDASSPE